MTMQSIRQCSIISALFILLAAIGGCGDTSVPSAPTGLTISSTVSQNNLTWNAVSGCSYNIYRGTASGSEALHSSGVTGTTYQDPPAVTSSTTPWTPIAWTPYYYVVTAVNTDAESGFSNEVSVTPPNLTLLGTTTSSPVNLSWTTVSGAASYNIYRSIASDAEGLPVLANTTSTSYTDNAASGTYYYRVTAKGQNGDETLGSNEVSATP